MEIFREVEMGILEDMRKRYALLGVAIKELEAELNKELPYESHLDFKAIEAEAKRDMDFLIEYGRKRLLKGISSGKKLVPVDKRIEMLRGLAGQD